MRFEDLKVTIMTSQIHLSKEIHIHMLYIMMNVDEDVDCICYAGFSKGKKRTKKSKSKMIREKFLKNHVSVHLSKGNINVKISKKKLTLIGCRSEEDIKYCGDIVCKKINYVNRICKIYKDNFLYILENHEYIIDKCRGIQVINPISLKKDYLIDKKWINYLEVDENILIMLNHLVNNFSRVSEVKHFLSFILTYDIKVYKKSIYPEEYRISMVNRMLYTGYKINLQSFFDIFSEIDGYYLNDYRCEIHHKLYLKILYKLTQDKKGRRLIKCITITIESSGSITISGPYKDVTKNEYNRFYKNLKKYRHLIEIN